MKDVCFVEMMGVPGSYDASVYDGFEDGDDEGVWFIRRFGDCPGVRIKCRNVCLGESLPKASEIDALVLAGSYNSVHDRTPWQQKVLAWLPEMRSADVPLLGICGSHQLIAYLYGSDVGTFDDGPYAGSYALELTSAGRSSPLFNGIEPDAPYHFANSDYVVNCPTNATLLAGSGKTAVATLDYGALWYTTQYHPEGTHETLGTIWQHSYPDLAEKYIPSDAGEKLVRNFLKMVADA